MPFPLKGSVTETAMRLRPLMLQIAMGAVQANEWDKIIRISEDSGGAQLYDATASGFTSALSDAVSGDMLWMPPAHISGDFTVPANVTLSSMGNDCVIDGKITLNGANAHIIGMVITYSDSSGSDLIGVDCANSSGTVYINDCGITVTNSGAGDAFGVQQTGAGNSLIWQANIHGIASGGGDGYALQAQAGDITIVHSKLQATTSGADSNPIFFSGIAGEVLLSAIGEGVSIDLWNGVDNDAEPANWYTVAFDDASWDANIYAGWPPPLTGTDSVGHYPTSDGWYQRKQLIRHEFTLAGAADLRIQMRIEDWLPLGVYVNGVNVSEIDPIITGGGGGSGGEYNTVDQTIDSSYFQAGTNLIAFEIQNQGGHATGVSYRLDGTGSGGSIYLYSIQMSNYDGLLSGEQMLGDRSAFNITNYSARHASDIATEQSYVHLPPPGVAGNIVYDDGTKWTSATPGTISSNFDSILTDGNYVVLVDDDGNVLTDDQ